MPTHAQEAAQRWPEQYGESQRRVSAMSAADRAAVMQIGAEVDRRLGALLAAGAAPGDATVQELIGVHYSWVRSFWTPDRDAYLGLGRMYVDDPRFTAHYDAVEPGLAVFVRDAIEVWAPAHLG